MPGFICPQHGNTYMTLICPHIHQGVTSGSLPGKIITMFINYGEFFSDPEEPLLFKHFYCSICSEQNEFPSEDTLITAEEFELMPQMRLIPSCAECFKEALNRDGIIVGANLAPL